eukprot:m.52267 g.52267  ORF g.52267 m.52267 type:complete len:72 (+) comp10781_c0_seq1:685-900(+)
MGCREPKQSCLYLVNFDFGGVALITNVIVSKRKRQQQKQKQKISLCVCLGSFALWEGSTKYENKPKMPALG